MSPPTHVHISSTDAFFLKLISSKRASSGFQLSNKIDDISANAMAEHDPPKVSRGVLTSQDHGESFATSATACAYLGKVCDFGHKF